MAITLLGIVVLMANNGLIIAGLTAFDGALVRDLHVGVTALKLRDTVTIVTLGLSVPVVGYLLDRIAAKAVIIAGLAFMAMGLAGYRWVHQASDIYALHVLLGLSQACCGLVSHIVLVSRWTGPRRGLALGAIVAGSSVGNGLAPGLNAWLAGLFGWRNAVGMGALVALALIPLVLAIYRERPLQTKLFSGVDAAMSSRASFRDVLRSGSFWGLSASAATTAFCILGLATSLVLYVERDLHRPVQFAARLLLLLFIGATGAQLAAGAAADRLGAGRVHVWLLVTLLVGAGLAATAGSAGGGWLSAAVLLFGVGWGGSASLLQIRPVGLFSGPALGRALAGIAVIETLGAAVAPPLMGAVYEATGHYKLGFGLMAAMAVLALVCIAKVRDLRASPPPLLSLQ